MSKTAQSGLRTVTRDFSSSEQLDIEWLPTPPPVAAHRQRVSNRLQHIQEGLSAGQAPPMPRGTALMDSKAVNKRTSPVPHDKPAAKKARRLPPSWTDEPPLESWNNSTNTAISKQSDLSSVRKPQSSTSEKSQTPTVPKKIAKIFLSHEQTQILNLVSKGESVFYTGSAGARICFGLKVVSIISVKEPGNLYSSVKSSRHFASITSLQMPSPLLHQLALRHATSAA